MRTQPKIKKIVNFIVAQTDCGVFVTKRDFKSFS